MASRRARPCRSGPPSCGSARRWWSGNSTRAVAGGGTAARGTGSRDEDRDAGRCDGDPTGGEDRRRGGLVRLRRRALAPVKGYKAHVAADEDGGIVRRVMVMPGTCTTATGWCRCCRPDPAGSGPTAPTTATRSTRDPQAARGAADRKGRNARMAPAKAAARTAWNRRSARCGAGWRRYSALEAQLRARQGALPRPRAGVPAGASDFPRLQPHARGPSHGHPHGHLRPASAGEKPRPPATPIPAHQKARSPTTHPSPRQPGSNAHVSIYSRRFSAAGQEILVFPFSSRREFFDP